MSISPQTPYLIPSITHSIEMMVSNSRFIATIAMAETTEAAKIFLAQIRSEMPDASHHVYAFRIGYGNSTIEGMSDDGEPSGTAGPPVLAVLRGTKIGDIVLVVTRYFGGTKLGTGGLVRAYTEAAQVAIESLPTALKIAKVMLGIEVSYPLYEQVKRLILAHGGMIQETEFETEVMVIAEFPLAQQSGFTDALRELSAGRFSPVVLE